MTEARNVLITGAGGNLGAKVRAHLEQDGRCNLRLLDVDPRQDESIIRADLSVTRDSWVRHFEGVDVVVHLAADYRRKAPWNSLQPNNVDATINVFEAALDKGVSRVVFASSAAAMAGYEGEGIRISHELMPRPETFYAVTKVLGERLGKSYSDRHGLSVICLRIGVIRRGQNLPRPGVDEIDNQRRWVSNRDLCQAIEKSILVDRVPYAVLNVVSNNLGTMWDLSETRCVLGYEPMDTCHPVPISRGRLFRLRLKRVRRLLRRIFGNPVKG